MTFVYRIAYFLMNLFYRFYYCVTCEGAENIPAEGGYLLVANHYCMKDPILLALAAKRQVYFMAKQEFFRKPFVGWLFRRLGAFPVDRGAGDMSSLGRGEELIREGKLVGLFPEGTRNRTGKPMRPKSGTAWIARATGASVIPCGLVYEGAGFRARMTVRFGKPIPYSELGFEEEGASSLRKASKLIMDRINQLTGAAEIDENQGS